MIAYQTDNPRHKIQSAVTYTNTVEIFVDDLLVNIMIFYNTQTNVY